MCLITITSVSGSESTAGAGPDALVVHGTADDCSSACVAIRQTSPGTVTTPEKTVSVDASGNWVANFRVSDGDFALGDFKCGRGNKAVVRAVCCSDKKCKTEFQLEVLSCGGDCPVISPPQAVVSPTCNSDGTRTVTISCNVTPGAGGVAVVQIVNEGGIGPAAQTATAPNTPISAPLDFGAGQHQASVLVIFPEDCNGADVGFTVGECDVTPVCPEITFVTDQSVCDRQGRRTVQINASVVLAGSAVAARLLRVDANDNAIGPPLATGSDAGGNLTLMAAAAFQADSAPRFRVRVTQPAGCPGLTTAVDLPPCSDDTDPANPPVVVPPPPPPPRVCPWWWLLPLGLTMLLAGVALTVVGGCAAIAPLVIAGGIVGGLAMLPLTFWAYLCHDCPAMRTVLLTAVGAFDVLAVIAIVTQFSVPTCAPGFLAAALMVASTVFGLAVPYLVLCVTGCAPLRIALGVLAGLYAALLLAALITAIAGLVVVTVVLVIIAAIVAAIALNLVLVPLLVSCA